MRGMYIFHTGFEVVLNLHRSAGLHAHDPLGKSQKIKKGARHIVQPEHLKHA